MTARTLSVLLAVLFLLFVGALAYFFCPGEVGISDEGLELNLEFDSSLGDGLGVGGEALD